LWESWRENYEPEVRGCLMLRKGGGKNMGMNVISKTGGEEPGKNSSTGEEVQSGTIVEHK